MERVHELKCWAPYFDAVAYGEKTFEIRKDDRGFQRGDIVQLKRCVKMALGNWDVERDLDGKPMSVISFRIGWILTGGQFGLALGYIAFSLEILEAE